jgi:flagellar motor switch protein FliG
MPLAGATKAAVLLLSLPEERALPLLQHFEEEELRQLRKAVDDLGTVEAETIDRVYVDFAESFRQAAGSMRVSSVYLQELVRKAHGEDEALRVFAANAPSRPRTASGNGPLAVVERADPELLAATLTQEHPQVIAAVLAHLDSTVSAEVVAHYPVPLQSDVVRRISRLQRVAPEALGQVAQAVGVLDLGRTDEGTVDGVNIAATILNRMAGSTSEEVLARLAEDAPEEAASVKRAMFTFETLTDADTRGLQQLLREIPSDTLLKALRAASVELRDRIFSCMSSRSTQMLREEMALMPPVRRADVESAQQEIVDVALRLIADRKLLIAGRGEQMV